MLKSILLSITITVLFLFTGCRTASHLLDSTIRPKSHDYSKSTQLLNHCNFLGVNKLLDNNKNNLLKNSEKGLIYFYENEYAKSNKHFDTAIDLYRDNENKALFDISTFLTKEYQGEGYDKVFLHNYKAISYLLLGNAQSARVEARNANISQQEARQKLNRWKQDKRSNNNDYILSRYEKLFRSVNAKHNPYQNPFAYYISALSYAEDEDYDNALIDIRKALAFVPNSKILKEKLKVYSQQKRVDSIELFFDVGQSPLKSQVQLEIDLGNGEKRMASLPTFLISKSNIDYIKISDNQGNFITQTSLLSDINAIKINDFKEKLPMILSVISKELLLSTGSEVLNSQKADVLAGILKAGMAIYSQNDQSTWSLLPQKILVASVPIQDANTYTITTYTKSGKALKHYPLVLNEAKSTRNAYKHFIFRKSKMCLGKNQI